MVATVVKNQRFMDAYGQWPADRKAGLTFGELSSIKMFLQHYLIVTKTLGTGTQALGNMLGDSEREIFETVLNAWNNSTVPDSTREQLATSFERLLAIRFGIYRPQKMRDSEFRHTRYKRNGVTGKPLVQLGRGTLNMGGSLQAWRGLRSIPVETWYRLVGVLALDRDLFAEQLEDIGGIKAGLNDSLEDLLVTAPAVTGRWVPLAGRWHWKGRAADGRPILNSQPLIQQPAVMPFDWPQKDAENRAVFALLGDLAQSMGSRTQDNGIRQTNELASQASVIQTKVNRLAAILEDAKPINVPQTARGFMEAVYYLLKALKIDGAVLLKSVWYILLPEATKAYPVEPDPLEDYEQQTKLDLTPEESGVAKHKLTATK